MKTYECRERMSVRDAAALREELLVLMNSSDGLLIDMTRLERADLAVMQIFVAASKEGKKNGVMVKYKGLSSQIKRQMVICGMKK